MTTTTPVEKIIELLIGAGYRRLPMPLDIAGLKFDVPAALVGTHEKPDLIVVADTAFDTDERVKNKIEGIARALDVAKSKRPLTAVLAGPRPRTLVLDAISRVCRVLPIGSLGDGDEDAALRNWLAVLMPLRLPQTSDTTANPMNELLLQIGQPDSVTTELLAAAPRGSNEVEETLYKIISEPLSKIDSEAEQ